MSAADAFVVEAAGLTPEWLSGVLGRPVADVTVEQIGTGQIGTCYRLGLTWADQTPRGDHARFGAADQPLGGDHAGFGDLPDRMVAKLPATDPGLRDMLAGAYRGEVRFYTEIAPTVAVDAPALYHAAMADSGGGFTLLLQDLAPWRQGDQIAGSTPEQAHDAVVNLAGLHGPRWCDPALLDIDGLSLNGPDEAKMLAEVYAPAVDTFLADLGDRLDAADGDVVRRTADVVERWALDRAERFAPVHGDYRLDNLLFPDEGRGVCAVDWQTLSLALPARDVAYAVATSLPVAARREHEDALVTAYHEALAGHGVTGYSREAAWDDYRFSMVQGPLVAVLGCVYGTRTDRGDAMFAAMVSRSCAAIRDLETFELTG